MLAYVFWHWARPDVAVADYESRQLDFHDAFGRAPSQGFHRSSSHAIRGAPWANVGHDAYEDWYLVDDFVALGALNEAAISGSRRSPHDRAAVHAAGGTAGLYTLRSGSVVERPTSAIWFSKPDGMSRADLFSLFDERTHLNSAGLWERQMTLGPATMFCVLGHRAPLPQGLDGTQLDLRPVWPPR